VLEECAVTGVEHKGAEYEARRRHSISYDIRKKFAAFGKILQSIRTFFRIGATKSPTLPISDRLNESGPWIGTAPGS
jgi:hypothetical protein